jgi:hypothetical protein
MNKGWGEKNNDLFSCKEKVIKWTQQFTGTKETRERIDLRYYTNEFFLTFFNRTTV